MVDKNSSNSEKLAWWLRQPSSATRNAWVKALRKEIRDGNR